MTNKLDAVNPLHKAAREYAKQGIPIFPCTPGTKIPLAGSKGFHEATTDLDQVDKWWTEYPHANIAFTPHSMGWGIVDLDGEAGLEAWSQLEWKTGEDIPDTKVVRTPRGGEHWYYAGELPTTTWAPGRKRCLGAHIDTRGRGSYVLLPPSRTADGAYRLIEDRELAPVPAWITAKLARAVEAKKASGAPLDREHNIARVRRLLKRYVEKGHVAVKGEGGDNLIYALACEVLDHGLSPEKALEVLGEPGGWNAACRPPWSEGELWVKVQNAARYQQNEPGSKAQLSGKEVFGTLPVLKNAIWARIGDGDIKKIQREPIKWLWRDYIPLGMYTVLAGDGDTGKSAMLIDFCARVTSASMWPDGRGRAPRGRVILFNIEDNKRLILKARLEAAGVDLDLIRVYSRTWTYEDGTEDPIDFTQKEHRDILEAMIAADDAALVVIDPIVSYMHGVNLNDENEVRAVLDPLSEIAGKRNCAIIGNMHHGKGHKNAGNVNASILHSVAMVNVPRSVLQVASTDEELETRHVRVFEQTKYNVSEYQPPLQYIIEVVDMQTGKVIPHGTIVEDPSTRIKYLGRATTSIRELRSERPNKPGPDDEVCREAERFYQEYLAKGPQPSSKIRDAARAEGHSNRTLARARVKLAIRHYREGDIWMTALPEWQAGKQALMRPAPQVADNDDGIEDEPMTGTLDSDDW